MQGFKILRAFDFEQKVRSLYALWRMHEEYGITKYVVETGVDFGRNCQKYTS